MQSRLTPPISAGDLEQSLEAVRSSAAGQLEGVFGPASGIWQVDREAVVFLGAGRALLMQLAHPWVATAIAEHSSALSDPIGRFHRTFQIVFTLVFGSLDQALATARRLHKVHSAVSGVLPKTLGRHEHGSPYLANDPAALMWVHSTLVDTALATHELIVSPLSEDLRERYYADCRIVGLLFGIPLAAQPPDWPAFQQYIRAMLTSNELAVGPAAKEIAAGVLSGAGRIPVPNWYRDVTAALLPPSLRDDFALSYGAREQQRASRALATIRRVYPWLPRRLRDVPPHQEAISRVSGRDGPDLITKALNKVWIGRSAMPRCG